jgi:chemotaxis protein MotB
VAKKKHEEEHENHERWLVSYADFITLLFAFFTVLYATSQKDAAKAQEFQKSIQKAFKSFVDFGGVKGKFVDNDTATQIIPPPIDVVPLEGGPQETQDYLEREIQKALGEEDASQYISDIRSDTQGVHVSLAASSLFDPGESLLKEQALPALEKICAVISRLNHRFIIEGHTDNVPIHSGRFPSNWELSATRASTIVRYMIARHKINPSRLAAVGYADQKPLTSNDTPAGRGKNRRIDILIVTDDAKPL